MSRDLAESITNRGIVGFLRRANGGPEISLDFARDQKFLDVNVTLDGFDMKYRLGWAPVPAKPGEPNVALYLEPSNGSMSPSSSSVTGDSTLLNSQLAGYKEELEKAAAAHKELAAKYEAVVEELAKLKKAAEAKKEEKPAENKKEEKSADSKK